MTAALGARRGGQEPPGAQESSAPLWESRDLVRWGAVVAAAGVAIAITWFIAGGDHSYDHQVPPLDVAILALAVTGAANAALLLLGRRNIGLRRRALVGEAGAALDEASRTDLRSSAQPASVTLVGEAGLKHYHRSDCPMAIGRNWAAASREDHLAADRLPCGVCQP